jgi:hypothetical protein
MDHLKYGVMIGSMMTMNWTMKKRKLTISNQAGMPEAFSLPKINKISRLRLTNTFTITDKKYPKTMIEDIISPSGGCGRYCTSEANRKQTLQINATRESSLNNLIFD